MERALKKLLQVYPITRYWAALSNYVIPLQSVQHISQMYSTCLITDSKQLNYSKSSIRKDYISSDVKIPHDSIKILDIVASNYINMSMHNALETVSRLFKSSKCDKHVPNIENHAGFLRLCEVLNRDIRLMKIHNVIDTLKLIINFKIPTNTLFCQSMLQMIRATINEISLKDIILIIFLLKKMESTPLRDALLIALPLVLETQLPTKLDPNDLVLLTWLLRFTSEYNIKDLKIQDIILKSLWKFQNKLDVETAKSIFYSLCTLTHLSPLVFEVLHNVQRSLITGAKKLSVRQRLKLLDKLTFVISKNKEHGYQFYNEAFIDAFVNSALVSNINFTSGIYLLKLLNDINYMHIPLLEYLAAKCFEEPNLLKNAPYFEVFVFLEGFVNADYKPIFWDTIRDAILANRIEKKFPTKSLYKFALHLIALDCYNPSLLDQVFSQDIKNDVTKSVYAQDLLLLYQSLKMLYPMYNGSWPSQKILEYAITNRPVSSTCSLKPALERALGGPQYVYNNLTTKLGHYVDHVVVMRKGGYPIAINTDTYSTPNYIEDIKTPSESQMILIFNLPDTAYALNSQRLKSTWLLKMRSVEALRKSNTIAINSTSWMKLPEYERVPYLMQAIKLKCEDLSVSAN